AEEILVDVPILRLDQRTGAAIAEEHMFSQTINEILLVHKLHPESNLISYPQNARFTSSKPNSPMQEALIKLFLRACALLPLRGAHIVGAGVGRLLTLIPNRTRSVTHINLGLCMPELPAPERRRLATRCLVETGRTAAETGALWCWDGRRVMRLARATSGKELVDVSKIGRAHV